MKKILKLAASFLMAVSCLVLLPGAEAKADENNNIVYAQVPDEWENPCIWAWDADGNSAFEAWPGEEMEADANNEGWYYLYIPKGMTSIIINACEGTVQTSDLSTNDQDAWVTVASVEETELSNDKATEGEMPDYVEKMTIFAKVDDSWENPCLWAWSAPDGTNVFPNWPGQELSLEGDWYVYSVPNWVNSIIINGNLGEVQTTDISVETQKDVWVIIKGGEDYEVFYEEPSLGGDTSDATNQAGTETVQSGISTTVIVISVIAVLVAAGAVTGIVVAKKKK